MSTRMQQRRGTASQWISTNSGNGPILAAGEIGFESDTNKFKIGDGVNHWIDLTYFTDAESALASISSLVDGAPALLDTLNELAAAMGDDASFATTINNRINGVETALSTHNSDTTNVHGISDTTALATKSYVDDAVTNSTVDQATLAGTGLLWNAETNQFEVDSTIATETYADSAASSAVSDHASVTTSVHGIADTANLADKDFVAGLLTGATKTNIVITGDKDGLTITAENGVADSTTDNLAEGSNNKYFTDERAQDAIGNLVGTGLTYTDATGEIKVDTATIQARVSGVSDTEIGYLDGVTSKIQDQLDAKASSLNPVFTGTLTLPDNTITNAMMTDNSVDTAEIKNSAVTNAKLAGSIAWDKLSVSSTVSSTELGYVDGVTSSIQTQLDAKAPTNSPTFTGTVAGITKTMVGLANVDNTSDVNKPVSTATQSALNDKLSLSGGTMTGVLTLSGAPTSDLHAATKLYVDNISAGLNFHPAVHASTSTNITTDYNNGTNGLGATLTAMSNGAIGTVDGHQVVLNDRILVKAQTDAKQNGIYYVSNVGGASSKWVLTRALDDDNSPTGEVANGDFCFVQNGAISGGYGYIVTTTGTITVGTTDINYTQFNAGQAVTAGNGLVESSPGTLEIDTTVTQTRVSGVSDTEIGYLDGVTSAIQTQLNAKAPLSGPTFTGTVVLPSTTSIGNVSATEIGYVDGVTSAIQTQLDAKAPLSGPTFSGTVVLPSTTSIGNVSATEIGYVDGVTSAIQTQLDSKLASIVSVNAQTASYTVQTSDKDKIVEMNSGSANTLTIPLDLDLPDGSQIDILQVGSGQTTVAGAAGVTINATPGLKLRTQWAGATLRKRGTNSWVLVGDLTA